jgi:hypothetical protein
MINNDFFIIFKFKVSQIASYKAEKKRAMGPSGAPEPYLVAGIPQITSKFGEL